MNVSASFSFVYEIQRGSATFLFGWWAYCPNGYTFPVALENSTKIFSSLFEAANNEPNGVSVVHISQ